jgi:hypothetical protein
MITSVASINPDPDGGRLPPLQEIKITAITGKSNSLMAFIL